jgi:hypothetical protein
MDPALPGVNSMATATAKKPTKTAFVTGFLKKHPQANPTAVNEAWAKAGHTGSVSPSLVGRLRTDLGLSGNIRRTPGTAKKATKTRRRDEGKSSFIKELLVEHPQANADAVNKAWKKAGMEGTISVSLVTSIRSELGLTGNLPRGPRPGHKSDSTGKAQGTPATKRYPRQPGSDAR